MRRRDLLAGLLATTTASALCAAEPNKPYRLTLCWHFATQARGPFSNRLFDRLRQLGYVEGRNLLTDAHFAEDRPEAYPAIARDVVQAKPDVIMISWDNQFISQFAKETSTIPIVAMIPSFGAGIVRNMARPEGNVTGVAMDAARIWKGAGSQPAESLELSGRAELLYICRALNADSRMLGGKRACKASVDVGPSDCPQRCKKARPAKPGEV